MKRRDFDAVILDMDGVVTRTATLHAKAWKALFDDFLAHRSERDGAAHDPFDIEGDYRRYVDGKPRIDGARSFLESRGIELQEGGPDDEPGHDTLWALGNRKNALFRELLDEHGAETYDDAVAQVRAWRDEGLATALVTSSRNGQAIVEATGLHDLFDTVVDGVTSAELDLEGKPAPDIFLAAAERLGVAPERAVVLEDAVAGVQGGRAGGFGLVVGIARGDGTDLARHGADQVVDDVRDVNLAHRSDSENVDEGGVENRKGADGGGLDAVVDRLARNRLALFLDYDGTLTSIVERPEDATLSEEMRAVLKRLTNCATVAIVSGRELTDVQDLVGIENLYYAGSHGFDIVGPGGLRMQHEGAREHLPVLDEAQSALEQRLADIDGAQVERKRFAIAVHYRRVHDTDVARVEEAVDAVHAMHDSLRKKGGKKIFELQPDVDWHKGRALRWLMAQLELDAPDLVCVYVGDDVTDEDAFAALPERGIGIRVGAEDEPTQADHVLADTVELQDFLERLLASLEDTASGEKPRHREMHPWELAYDEWVPDEQKLREALCALGNGHIVTRGAFEECDAGGPHYPGTYVAGGFNRLESEVSGRIIENEDLVNWPNWLPLSFRPEGGDWFDLDAVDIEDFDYRLDVARGVLTRTVRFRDAGDREWLLVSRRIVHASEPHLAAIQWELTPLNWSGEVEVRSALDGSVVNDNVERYRGLSNRHLDILDMGYSGDDVVYLTVQTNQAKVWMTQAARTRVWQNGEAVPIRREREQTDQVVGQRLFVPCQERKPLRVEKVVSIRTGYDVAISEPEVNARQDAHRAGTFDDLLRSHATRWQHLWSLADIALVNGEVQTQLILRLHIFHLLQSVSPNTIHRDVGVPARGWHGEAYRGHIFWDELFIFPLLVLRIPELTRSLLMYRFRRLPEARHAAREAGYRGAMFPWQAGSDGREESQVLHLNPKSERWLPDTTHLQRHVNAAIAYNVWGYYQATGDREFMAYYGAEMIVEIARFWASIARLDGERGRYVITGVVGPDEFHTDDPNTAEPGLDNNAYTNVMAAWVLRCAACVLDLLDKERVARLKQQLGLAEEEQVHWEHVSRNLFVPFHGDGIISQFEGYERLEEFDWAHYRKRFGDVLRLDRILEAEGDDVNRYKASKQADVLMLFYLFSPDELTGLFDHMGYTFDGDMLERTVDYYMERTSHGSTLSQVVHSWVLARRDRERAWRFWQLGLRADIEDIQGGTTPEGIHLGAMAGTVDLIFRGHTGLVMEDDILWFDPELPEELADVRMRIRYRGHWLTVQVTQHDLTVSFDRGHQPAVKIGIRGEVVEMAHGEQRTFDLRAAPRPAAS